jgi:hypothetical protein
MAYRQAVEGKVYTGKLNRDTYISNEASTYPKALL